MTRTYSILSVFLAVANLLVAVLSALEHDWFWAALFLLAATVCVRIAFATRDLRRLQDVSSFWENQARKMLQLAEDAYLAGDVDGFERHLQAHELAMRRWRRDAIEPARRLQGWKLFR